MSSEEERQVLELLTRYKEGASSALLAGCLSMSRPHVEQLMVGLVDKRLVERRREGTTIYYLLRHPEASASAAEPKEQAEAKVTCQYCGKQLKDGRQRHSHETFCKANPQRRLSPGERKKLQREDAGKPPLPVEAPEPPCAGDCTIAAPEIHVHASEERSELSQLCELALSIESMARDRGMEASVDVQFGELIRELRVCIRRREP